MHAWDQAIANGAEGFAQHRESEARVDSQQSAQPAGQSVLRPVFIYLVLELLIKFSLVGSVFARPSLVLWPQPRGHLKSTKTEASAKLLPMHASLKHALLDWKPLHRRGCLRSGRGTPRA